MLPKNEAKKLFYGLITLGLMMLIIPGLVFSAPMKQGAKIPGFTFKSVTGENVSSKDLEASNMSVLFFFSSTSKSCLKGMKQLQTLVNDLGDRNRIVAIGKQDSKTLKGYKTQNGFTIPMVAASKKTMADFGVKNIYPTTYVIGPDGTVTDALQGGGGAIKRLLMTLAERQLQQKDVKIAEKLYRNAEKEGDDKGIAKAGIGYSLLKQGKIAEAETTFAKLSKTSNSEAALRGKEGMAQVYLSKGDMQKAMQMADEVIKKAPNRSTARLVKGQALYRTGNKKAAVQEIGFTSKSNAQSDFAWQKAEANFANGNIQKENGNLEIALTSYKKAVKENPYYVEAMSNQGVALKEMGKPEKAMDVFSKVKKIDPNDKLVASLIRQAQAAIAQKQDLEHQKYIDSMVKDLLKQFDENKKKGKAKSTDDWTSPPMVVSILGFQQSAEGALMGRAGMDSVLQEELTTKLLSKKISVVERAVLDKLLAELKLGSSDLADQDAALKLGRIMAARMIATGKFFTVGKQKMVSIRLINTETTDIVLSLSEKKKGELDPISVADKFASKIKSFINEKYPHKGRVAFVENDIVIINLGKKHGVQPGEVFKVVGDGKPIELNGKILGYMPADLGLLELTKVEDLMAYAKIKEKKGEWKTNQKVIQK